jgi:hypothetical protein
VITYRVRLDVPRELVLFVSRLLARRRKKIGTRKNTRSLGCYRQALFVLAWYRDKADIPRLGAGFGLSQATSYRYVAEGTKVVSAEAPGLEEALERAVKEGTPYVILDGKIVSSDRCHQKTVSQKGREIDLWYSGKKKDFGGNIQGVFCPGGQPDTQPGERGDRAGRGGEPVGEDDRVARLGLDVADVPGDAHRQPGQRGGPGPDPLPGGPAVEVGDVERELADGQEHVDLGGPGLGLPATSILSVTLRDAQGRGERSPSRLIVGRRCGAGRNGMSRARSAGSTAIVKPRGGRLVTTDPRYGLPSLAR